MATREMDTKIWGLIGILVIAAWLLGSVTDAMAVKGEEVIYKANGVVLKGYIAYDDAVTGKRPGVLVVHDWWGPSEFVRDRVRALAKLGYTGLAVDMYGEGKEATNPDEAGKLAGELRKNPSMMKARFDAAQAALSKHPSVDSKGGWCWRCFFLKRCWWRWPAGYLAAEALSCSIPPPTFRNSPGRSRSRAKWRQVRPDLHSTED